jgi:hypothetical protein
VTEDEEFVAREELFDLRQFFGRDGRDGIACFFFGSPLSKMRAADLKRENIVWELQIISSSLT